MGYQKSFFLILDANEEILDFDYVLEFFNRFPHGIDSQGCLCLGD